MGHRLETCAFHVGADLVRHLLEHLLGEVTPCERLVELYELDDVTCHRLSVRILEEAVVAIKLFHGTEVG